MEAEAISSRVRCYLHELDRLLEPIGLEVLGTSQQVVAVGTEELVSLGLDKIEVYQRFINRYGIGVASDLQDNEPLSKYGFPPSGFAQLHWEELASLLGIDRRSAGTLSGKIAIIRAAARARIRQIVDRRIAPTQPLVETWPTLSENEETVLRCLNDHYPRPVTFTEIEATTGISRKTVSKVIHVLVREDFGLAQVRGKKSGAAMSERGRRCLAHIDKR